MNPETASFFLQVFVAITSAAAVGVGVYAGIKNDLAVSLERANSAKERAEKAHDRIDEFLRNEK